MIVLITGATDGLGRGLARALDADGHTVLVHGRSEQRIADTVAELSDRTRSYRADLASLAEVGGLADEVLEHEPQLDVLVNNAGIGADGGREESADGYELRFAVNYLAGFLLTRRLGDLPGRVVNVASAGQAPIDFDDVMLERRYGGGRAYSQSKLALIMFTLDLAEELNGSGVTANSLHPGTYMPTGMVKAAGVRPITPLEDGIAATLRLIESPELEGVSGSYFDGTEESAPHPQAYDPQARRRLRELSEELTGLHATRS
jgi:NAD(P)-dependent dehydrogenase (short-subunit alcohol dehydrogenase family)